MNDHKLNPDQMKQLGGIFMGFGCLIMMLPIVIVCIVILGSIIGSMFN